jgi:uncharacterized protein YbgA (DUF1722 family)/uncharacterized protein YbbK (DUF523 family)
MRIGVSACLLGDKVRYDGTDAKDKFVLNELGKYFEILGYCPEAPAFGTPRDTIRLVEVNDEIQVQVGHSGQNVTQTLNIHVKEQTQKTLQDELCGFVLKSKSPSCGLERVKVFTKPNLPGEKRGVGVFAKELLERHPYLPIEEDGRLNDPWLKENFLMQVFAYSDLQKLLKSNPAMKDIVAFHTDYKYLIFAKSEASYKKLGKIVANHEKKDIKELLENYNLEFKKAINEKSTIKKTYNVLLHIIGYFKKYITKEEKEHLLDACNEYKEQIIPLIAVTKMINLYVDKCEEKYLKTQKFLHPYPKELSLRSDIKAYK